MSVEVKQDLGLQREQTLFAKWTHKRLSTERSLVVVQGDGNLATLMMPDLLWEAKLLDHFLVRVPERMATFDTEQAKNSVGALNMLHGFLEEIRSGEETPKDILIVKGNNG